MKRTPETLLADIKDGLKEVDDLLKNAQGIEERLFLTERALQICCWGLSQSIRLLPKDAEYNYEEDHSP